jgi:predicted ATP-grasp superfamily ATP-dependent carboligase
MSELIELWGDPKPAKCMIAGWVQWADAGTVSSGLPDYLIEQTQAQPMGEIVPGPYYLFQIPGTHHLMRPVVTLKDGHRKSLEQRGNQFFYTGDDRQGCYVFLGEEPHRNAELYADAFFDAVEELGVKRVIALAGVYGAVPYDKDRNISCVYSLPWMKEELERYAVRFSNYDGGATISMYMADRAERRGIEFLRFCALVPSYDFSSNVPVQSVSIGEDYRAWYELMLRIKHMFQLNLDLSDLEELSQALVSDWHDKIDQLSRAMPQLEVGAYMAEVYDEFTERPFVALSDVWEDELRDLLDDF